MRGHSVFLLGAALFGCVLATSPAHASPNPNGFWISLGAQYRTGTFERDYVGLVLVNVPLGRFAAPRFAEPTPKKEAEPTSAAPAPAPTASSAPKKDPLVPVLTPRLARGAVRHALAAAGYVGARGRIANAASRARSSAVLPEMRLRTLRSTGENLRLTPTLDNPYGYTQGGTSELLFEARLTWHLDRLVFADEEVALERLRTERDLAERKLIEHVLERLTAWQRCLVRAADEDNEPDVRETAELEALGAAVELDVLTDGWFSQVIAETAPPPPAVPMAKSENAR